jgi:hypothetical protein
VKAGEELQLIAAQVDVKFLDDLNDVIPDDIDAASHDRLRISATQDFEIQRDYVTIII